MQRPNTNPQGQELIGMRELREIAELLVKHQGMHEGLYDLAIEFQIGVGGVGPSPELVLPGAMVGVKRIGLKQAVVLGPATVDASVINPLGVAKKVAATKASAKKVSSK